MYEKFFLPTVPYLFKFTTQNLHSKQQVITQFPDRNPWERIHISAGRAEYISERHKHTKQEQIRPQNQKTSWCQWAEGRNNAIRFYSQ